MSTETMEVCPVCNGTGKLARYSFEKERKCKLCKGKGRVTTGWVKCPACRGVGEGKRYGGRWPCSVCSGRGGVPIDVYKDLCRECGGLGKRNTPRKSYEKGVLEYVDVYIKCSYCHGTGKWHELKEITCDQCNGTGKKGKQKVRVPATKDRDAYDSYIDVQCPMCYGRGKISEYVREF